MLRESPKPSAAASKTAMPDDQPSRILAILLGASTFPNSKLPGGKAFYNSATDLQEYLEDARGLGLPRENVLSLFDVSDAPSVQLIEAGKWLRERTREPARGGCDPTDLLIYYVGHGLFARGDQQAYCLATRSTHDMNQGATSIRASDLAGTIRENAAFVRRYLILDCCFSASILKEFQSGAVTAVSVQIRNEFQRGTALLCSSSAGEVSKAPQELVHTMFSHALIQSLRQGHRACGPRLSISELGDVIKERISRSYAEGVRPEVHSPDQREGDIAKIPLFPNPAYRERETVKERARPTPERPRQSDAEPARQKSELGRIQRTRTEAEEKKRVTVQKAEAEEKKRIASQNAAAEAVLERTRRKRAEAAEKKRIAEAQAAVERKRFAEQQRLAEKKEAAEKQRIVEAQAAAQRASAERASVQVQATAAKFSKAGEQPNPPQTIGRKIFDVIVAIVLLLGVGWATDHIIGCWR